jgi:hypothetical protein
MYSCGKSNISSEPSWVDTTNQTKWCCILLTWLSGATYPCRLQKDPTILKTGGSDCTVPFSHSFGTCSFWCHGKHLFSRSKVVLSASALLPSGDASTALFLLPAKIWSQVTANIWKYAESLPLFSCNFIHFNLRKFLMYHWEFHWSHICHENNHNSLLPSIKISVSPLSVFHPTPLNSRWKDKNTSTIEFFSYVLLCLHY